MAERRINSGMVVSAAAHAAVLLWTAVSFAARPLEAPPMETLPVEMISTKEVTQMVTGSKTAPKKETPKPLVEKKAEPRPVENQKAEVSEKPEIIAATPPPPAAEPPPQPKAAEKPEAPQKEPEKKLPDAEALKPEKPEPKKEPPKKLAATAPVPPKRPEPKKPEEKKQPQQEPSRFNADQIQSLLDKRQPRRMAAAGETPNTTPDLGFSRTNASQLAQNELQALARRMQECWEYPAGFDDNKVLKFEVVINLNKDGTLAVEPKLVTRVSGSYQLALAEGALRGIRRCAPYKFLSPSTYEQWKEVIINFDPQDRRRG